jgi:hypothetical protein
VVYILNIFSSLILKLLNIFENKMQTFNIKLFDCSSLVFSNEVFRRAFFCYHQHLMPIDQQCILFNRVYIQRQPDDYQRLPTLSEKKKFYFLKKAQKLLYAHITAFIQKSPYLYGDIQRRTSVWYFIIDFRTRTVYTSVRSLQCFERKPPSQLI